MSDIVECPICYRGYHGLLRYSNSVCNECINIYPIYDIYGNTIEFCNNWEENNIISYLIIDGKKIKSSDTICFINGIQCKAERGRVGGIIMKATENRNKKQKLK